jgi:hypothetical protein
VDPKKNAARPPQQGVQQAQQQAPNATSQTQTQQPVVQQPTQPPVEQPAALPPATAQPRAADNAAVQAELQQVREQLGMLDARAGSIRGTLQRMESQQNAAGYGLNSKWAVPRDLMNQFMEQTTNALNSGDPVAAKAAFKKAQYQVERLEKDLNMH